MREAASRGFWMTTYAPYGYKRVHVQDRAAKRPKLELNPPADAVVRRVFDMMLQGKSILDVTKTLNAEGIPTTNGKKWLKTTIHTMLSHEAYTGTVVWGANAKDGAPPVRVEDAHPAIVSKRDFQKARRLLGSRAPKKVNPRRASSSYLLSGIAKCETCGKAMTAAEAKSGKYTYYICHSLLKRGKGTCKTPRLNAKSFEKLIVNEIREHVLTESNIRDLVKLLDEEMDGVARDQRERLQNIEEELEDVKKRLARIWNHIETTDTEMADASDRIKEHRERKEKLEVAAEEARALLKERRQFLDSADTIATFAAEMSEFLKTSELTETKAFVGSFVKEVVVKPGRAAIVYSIPRPDDESQAFFESVLPDEPRVQVRPMFGNVAGFVNGNMFVGLFGSDLFVRLPDPDRAELLKQEGSSILEPMKGRPMKEYATVPESWRDEPDRARAWVVRSLNWVGEMPAKKPKQKG